MSDSDKEKLIKAIKEAWASYNCCIIDDNVCIKLDPTWIPEISYQDDTIIIETMGATFTINCYSDFIAVHAADKVLFEWDRRVNEVYD